MKKKISLGVLALFACAFAFAQTTKQKLPPPPPLPPVQTIEHVPPPPPPPPPPVPAVPPLPPKQTIKNQVSRGVCD